MCHKVSCKSRTSPGQESGFYISEVESSPLKKNSTPANVLSLIGVFDIDHKQSNFGWSDLMCFTTLRLVIATVGTRCVVPIYLRHSQGMMLYLISPPEENRKHPGMKNKTREHISNLTVLTRNITAIRMCWRMFIHLSGRHRKKKDVWIGPRIQQNPARKSIRMDLGLPIFGQFYRNAIWGHQFW